MLAAQTRAYHRGDHTPKTSHIIVCGGLMKSESVCGCNEGILFVKIIGLFVQSMRKISCEP